MADDRVSTAYHEAARAVAYCALWRPFLYVTIVPDEESLGRVKGMPFPHSREDSFGGDFGALLGDEAVVCLVGQIAEREYRAEFGQIEPEELFQQLSSDDQTTVEMAVSHPSPGITMSAEGTIRHDTSATLDELVSRATGAVMDWWGPIDTVAKALLAEGSLTAARVHEIVNNTPYGLPPRARALGLQPTDKSAVEAG
jgi:hypothetical protein